MPTNPFEPPLAVSWPSRQKRSFFALFRSSFLFCAVGFLLFDAVAIPVAIASYSNYGPSPIANFISVVNFPGLFVWNVIVDQLPFIFPGISLVGFTLGAIVSAIVWGLVLAPIVALIRHSLGIGSQKSEGIP